MNEQGKVTRSGRTAFTLVELLVVVSIIGLLIGILLPAIQGARDQALVMRSQGNMRNLAAAHARYAAEWSDRQFTLIDDHFANEAVNPVDAARQYHASWGMHHPPIILGWAAGSGGYNDSRHGNRMWGYWPRGRTEGNAYRLLPINFDAPTESLEGWGSFRMANAKQFNQYVSGRFYDPVFFAPKDRIVREHIGDCLDSPDEFCIHVDTPDGGVGWTSYVMSPAAMMDPSVLASDDNGGFQHPFTSGCAGGRVPHPAAFRSPSFSQVLYPTLKTHMLEHHWLQNNMRVMCNEGLRSPDYDGCEPYYFDHAWESTPVTLFYDGHVGQVGTRDAMRADSRHAVQTGGQGLWSRDTTWCADGYFIAYGYDQAATSYHVLTTDGAARRDTLQLPD